jgi:hypothetical protein
VSAAVPSRRIWLCADDYGLSPGVNRAIRELIAQRRLNATSVMVVAPACGRDEVAALREVSAAPPCAIGLHCTLTAPFHPITMHFKPLHGGAFYPLGRLLQASFLRRLDPELIRGEIAAQIAAFADLVGRPPDYVDGHQHVQIFPQIRDAFLAAVKEAAPEAWVRQCGRSGPLRPGHPKVLLLDLLSLRFRTLARRAGLAVNPGFAGAYDFTRESDFGALMGDFLADLPDGGLIMCHPGYVDDVLTALDPLTGQRERERTFLAGDGFTRLMTAQSASLAEPRPSA